MIKIDATILIQFINFIVLMAVLNVLLYRPLRDMLRKRREKIESSTQAAQGLEGQIEEKMNRYQQQLQEAKAKGNQERAAMRKAAAEEENRILGAAQTAASDKVRKVKDLVASEAAAARAALTGETETIAAQIASKVLGRGL